MNMRTQSLKFRLLALGIVILMISCSDTNTGSDDLGLSETQRQAVEYFKEIALGFEFGNSSNITRKWDRDIMIFVGGDENETLQNELDNVTVELNDLISQDNIEITVTADTAASNFYVFFGPGATYAELDPRAEGFTEQDFGLFFVSWTSNRIRSGSMYVDTNRPAQRSQLHLLREELTQALGMAKDSDLYPNSIFNSNYSVDVTMYSDLDKAVIQMLYHPQMDVGLNEQQVDPILRDIVVDVIE